MHLGALTYSRFRLSAMIGSGNLDTIDTAHIAGDQGGAESITLSEAQLPSHTHAERVSDSRATTKEGDGAVIAESETFNGSASASETLESSILKLAFDLFSRRSRRQHLLNS